MPLDNYYSGLRGNIVNYITDDIRFRNGRILILLNEEKIKTIWKELDIIWKELNKIQVSLQPKTPSFGDQLINFTLGVILPAAAEVIVSAVIKRAASALFIDSKINARAMAEGTVLPANHPISVHIQASTSQPYASLRSEFTRKLFNGIDPSTIVYEDLTISVGDQKLQVSQPKGPKNTMDFIEFGADLMGNISSGAVSFFRDLKDDTVSRPENTLTIAGLQYNKFEQLSKIVDDLEALSIVIGNKQKMEMGKIEDELIIASRYHELFENRNFYELQTIKEIKDYFKHFLDTYYRSVMFLNDSIFYRTYTHGLLSAGRWVQNDTRSLIKIYRAIMVETLTLMDGWAFDWVIEDYFNKVETNILEYLNNKVYFGKEPPVEVKLLSQSGQIFNNMTREISFKIVEQDSVTGTTKNLWVTLHQKINLMTDAGRSFLTGAVQFSFESYALLNLVYLHNNKAANEHIKSILDKNNPSGVWDSIPAKSGLQMKKSLLNNPDVPTYFEISGVALKFISV